MKGRLAYAAKEHEGRTGCKFRCDDAAAGYARRCIMRASILEPNFRAAAVVADFSHVPVVYSSQCLVMALCIKASAQPLPSSVDRPFADNEIDRLTPQTLSVRYF